MRILSLFAFVSVLFGLMYAPPLAAQQSQRKAWLGAQISPLTAEELSTQPLKGVQGLRIVQCIGGTSVAIGMMPDDILLSLDGVALASVAELRAHLSGKTEGQTLSAEILRSGKKKTLKGSYAGRPLETDDNAEVIYTFTPYRGGQLRTIINKPHTEGKLPALLFIPGYTCTSIDGLAPNHPYKRIIDAYVDAGFVTLRIEKTGLGDSYGTPACDDCDLMGEIESFENGLKMLKSLPYVDTTQIIIFGHSMGGIIAPAIAARNRVQGTIVYGTTAKSWYEYMLELNRLQNLLSRPDPLEHEQFMRDQYEITYRYFVRKEALSDLAKDPKADTLLRTLWAYDGKGRIFERNAEYWRQIQDMPLLENWKNTSGKVLVLYGESDFQAFSREDHEQIVYTVNYYQPQAASLHSFPLTDHNFSKAGTMQEAFDAAAAGQTLQLFDAYNPEVGHVSVKWSQSLSQSKPEATGTWQKLNTEPYPGKQDDIWFINEQEGWYVNGYGSIYHTRDGGQNWEKQIEKKGTFFRTIAFVDSLTGFAGTVGTDYFPNVTDTIPLYGTRDGGKTWQAIDYQGPYVKGLCAMDIVREPYINHGVLAYRSHIYAVGRVGSPASMMVSHDGGQSWQSWSLGDYGSMFFDIDMFDLNNGIACSASSADIAQSNALILKTRDGGKSWEKVYQSDRPMETTWKVSFPTPQVGYATIQSYNPNPAVKQQRIAKTTDGGQNWTEINLTEDNTAREFGIGFIDATHGFVGTLNSGFETRDGGQSWQKVDLGRACNKIRIYGRGPELYGYAIGVGVYKLTGVK
ncbi:MAG: alpha/beta fold hydrolase [Bacteroidetes bacterium]|nr:MAG: alpha/beta fold hydrolase [Bacteroidota bacterium]